MKKYLVFISILTLVSTSAFARNFYKSNVKITLTHSSLMSKTKKIGSKRGKLVFSDDAEVCQLIIKESSYQCQVYIKKLSASGTRREYTIQFSDFILTSLLESQLTKDDQSILADVDFRRSYAFTYDTNTSYRQFEQTEDSVQLHTDNAEESFHVIMKFGQAYIQ